MSEGILPRDITPEQLKAAYALNLCTVSVSQIVDYKDVCILEQEYNAILNNLNLEVIPKDDALLRTLTEILNTITFFRIQEIRKEQLDKEYQRRLKNAIWSAIPSLNVVVSNNPAVMALSLAAQVGTAYMSYRREKANAKADHERAETELEITAIEQLNALRRELFTTAWRLADAYHFPDRLRLTENQITQYDHILMDADLYRRYARLEAIAQNFAAYPPFWYNFAHTALCIALADPNPATQAQYRDKALAHFEHHRAINRFNLLREDQLTAACDLEYADLLLQSGVPAAGNSLCAGQGRREQGRLCAGRFAALRRGLPAHWQAGRRRAAAENPRQRGFQRGLQRPSAEPPVCAGPPDRRWGCPHRCRSGIQRADPPRRCAVSLPDAPGWAYHPAAAGCRLPASPACAAGADVRRRP